MADEIIIIDIELDGSATFEVKGVTGKRCQDITAALVAAAGGATKVVKKPEYNRVDPQQMRVRK